MSLLWGRAQLRPEAVPDWLDEVAACGYEGVSLFEHELLAAAEIHDLGALLAERGLALASVDHVIAADDRALAQLCALMAQLGAEHLVALGGLARRDAEPRRIAQRLDAIGAIARDHGLRACYHHHTNHTGETEAETERLLALTDPQLVSGFCDTGHATKDFTDQPVATRAARFIARNRERIGFVELKDWSPERGLFATLGTGVCDFAAVLAELRAAGYRGWITIEQNGPDGAATPRQCAQAALDRIRQELAA